MLFKSILSTVFVSCLMASGAAAQTVFIKDAKVVTNTDRGIIETANVLITDGRISDISAGLPAPSGAEIIEGNGRWVTPGLFAPMAQIGIVEIGAEDATNDSRASKAKTSVSTLGSDSFNPNSPVIDITRVSGITHAAIAPSASHNIFGGTGFVADTSGDLFSPVDDRSFIYVQLGERGAGLAGGSRSASMMQLRAALDDALALSRYNSRENGDALPRRDAAALAPAARGQMPLVIGADRASDLLKIIDLKNAYGRLDIIVLGAAEGWMVADALAENFIRVIVDPLENLPASFDRVGSRLDNAAILHNANVEVALSTRSAGFSHNIRVLGQHAGNAVANGMKWEDAFKAISDVPARWFNKTSGRLVVGNDANLVLWDGDPLEVTSRPQMIFIDGKRQSMESRQTELRDRYNPASGETKPHKYR